ncbi:MAG: L-cysteate sulfo-lyase [Parasphingorhabdus sp.]|jgi:L-cysteate sulfo-lyase
MLVALSHRFVSMMNLSKFARTSLGHFPTPLEKLDNLGKFLGLPNLYIKRDDCTGLATGGNKTRKLEYLVADAIAAGADTLVTQGATQSNHVRQTAAAARKLGMGCYALLERRVNNMGDQYESAGNVFLDDLLECIYEFRPEGLDMNQEGVKLAESLREKGLKPYFIPGGGSNEIGALGYANCAIEMLDQAKVMGLRIDSIVHATGSTGTQAGLLAGLHGLGSGARLQGVSVRAAEHAQIDNVHRLAVSTAKLIGTASAPDRADVLVNDQYVGPGYGQPTDKMVEAIKILAREEAILLDPVYSGKGMAGLIGMAQQGEIDPAETVVFLHTGGAVGLFAYQHLFR